MPDKCTSVDVFRIATRYTTPFCMCQRNIARNAMFASQPFLVEPVGNHQGNLTGAEACRQDQSDLIAAIAAFSLYRTKGVLRLWDAELNWDRLTGWRIGGEHCFWINRSRLLPIPPYRHLRMPGLFSDRPLPSSNIDGEIEHLLPQFLHRYAVLVSTGVDIHVVLQHFISRGSGNNFDCRNKREVRNRSVAGDKEDHI